MNKNLEDMTQEEKVFTYNTIQFLKHFTIQELNEVIKIADNLKTIKLNTSSEEN